MVSPDAHEPLGFLLSARRRQQAVSWAQATGGWLVEVAGGAVFRPQAGLPGLSELAGGNAVVIGGFGAVLGPGSDLGYAVVPASLVGPVRELVAGASEQPPYVLQRVVAELLAGGTVTQLMHRLGQAYRRKWRLAEPVLRRLGVLAGPGGAGTAVLCLPGGRDARVAAAALRDRGVRVRPLAEYYAAAQPAKGWLPAPARSGLVVGYGHLPDPALRTGLAALAASLGRQCPA